MTDISKPKLIILTGPTAVGKTDLSISLAKKIDGEIISADSMQVYKYMDVGTAKITKEEMNSVPHHLIDILDPKEEFNVFKFQTLAKEALLDINKRGKIPIVVGGTGFYIQALLYDISFEEENDEDLSYREMLNKKADENGIDELLDMLKEVDYESYMSIPKGNRKRIIRALEFYHIHNYPISEHNERERQKESPYDFRYFVLTDSREKIYERIDKRVDIMIENGLLDETKSLLKLGLTKDDISMKAIGYKEIIPYIEGNESLESCIDTLKKDTRHFAKRQLTWFRRERDVIWLDRNELLNDEVILDKILKMI